MYRINIFTFKNQMFIILIYMNVKISNTHFHNKIQLPDIDFPIRVLYPVYLYGLQYMYRHKFDSDFF